MAYKVSEKHKVIFNNSVIFLLIFCLNIFVFVGAGKISAEQDSELPKFTQSEIIVKFKPNAFIGTSFSLDSKQFNQRYSTQVKELFDESISKRKELFRKNGLDRVFKIKLKLNQDPENVVSDYIKSGRVEYAEPNRIYQLTATPDDTFYGNQWGLLKVDAEDAWDIQQGDPSISVAVIDTGVDWDHPDLDANIWTNTPEDDWIDPYDPNSGNSTDDDSNTFVDDYKGWDFVDIDDPENLGYCQTAGDDCEDRDNDPMDFHGHGTHVSGIASAVTDNATGVAGMAWNVKIMALRAGCKISVYPYGYLEEDDAVAAVQYAVDMDADVINTSWGSYVPSSSIGDLVNYARDNGVIWVAAAANDNIEFPLYPAVRNGVIAVAATEEDDDKANFSNYGSWVDVSAPGGGVGTDIYSTMFNDTYGYMAGTSMATPLVAGIAALTKSYQPTWSYDRIFAYTRNRVDNIYSLNPLYVNKLGAGRANAKKSLIGLDSMHPDGTLVQVSGDPSVYYLDGVKKHIPSPAVFNSNFSWDDIVYISTSERDGYVTGPQIMYKDGTLIKAPGGAVYVLEYGAKRHIISPSVFNDCGYSWSKMISVTSSESNRYSRGLNLSSCSSYHPSGSLVQASGDPAVYLLDNGCKRHILSPIILFERKYTWSDIISISTAERNAYPTSSDLGLPDGTLISGSGPEVYVLEYGEKRHILSPAIFNTLNYKWSNVLTISDTDLSNYPDGPDLS